MINSACALVSTAYFPPVEYFMAAAGTGKLLIEDGESYVKQSYRNRCRIYACDGSMSLTVPVSLSGGRSIRSAKIDYSKPWLQQHERALISAYRTSAFFEYYQDDIFSILDSRPESLLELNTKLTIRLLGLLGLKCTVELTGQYVKEYGHGVMDLRDAIHPKKTVPDMFRDRFKPYYQVFSDKYGFIPGLSVLDLLFNEGPNALTFLL
ncbi:MAG TPA: WbqC family protein [Candidatus Coprenecus stercoravium]|uniref:WbqC family protein n=1 Tax=Candidatus Coprenecus stercoravium TaxID=2840735 RepID=A0A9D2GN13_9BACT|nr:WbqC family protein [Candidatus Coprenecus stercoravium]